MEKSGSGKTGIIFTIIGISVLVFVIIAIWYIPRSVGDLFISLAAGRDILAGHLNQPDTWSFSTAGKVWINQNWGADLILYMTESALGETGLLAVKAILLLLCALFLILALMKTGIPPAVSVLVAAIVMVSINVFAILRPNLFTLVFVPLLLWFLYKTKEQSRFIWFAGLVVIIWANVHAGFMYGLGMIWLMIFCIIGSEAVKEKAGVFKSRWQLLAGGAGATLLCGIANPFGFINLTLPFQMMKGGIWLGIRDWRPIWESGVLARFSNAISNFIIILCIIAAIILIRTGFEIFRFILSQLKGNQYKKPVFDYNVTGITIFETIAALVAVIMAVLSNRFIVIALIMTAPLLARQIRWVTEKIKFSWIPLTAAYCIVIAYGSLIIYNNKMNYDPANPVINTGTGSLFEKMHYVNKSYNAGLVRFINTNRISGNVFSPWEWEGYLKWNCPQLKIYAGGRAQQVYTEEIFAKYLFLSGNNVAAYQSTAPEDILDSIDAHYIITGNAKDSDETILTALNCGNWVIVYADERNILFANTRTSGSAEIAGKMAENRLVFDNPAAEALSRAAFVFSQPDRWENDKLIDLFARAFDQVPAWLWGYNVLLDYTQSNAQIFSLVPVLLDSQLTRLVSLPLDGSDAVSILLCRIYLSDALGSYARQLNRAKIAAEEQKILNASKHLHSELIKKWKQVLAF